MHHERWLDTPSVKNLRAIANSLELKPDEQREFYKAHEKSRYLYGRFRSLDIRRRLRELADTNHMDPFYGYDPRSDMELPFKYLMDKVAPKYRRHNFYRDNLKRKMEVTNLEALEISFVQEKVFAENPQDDTEKQAANREIWAAIKQDLVQLYTDYKASRGAEVSR